MNGQEQRQGEQPNGRREELRGERGGRCHACLPAGGGAASAGSYSARPALTGGGGGGCWKQRRSPVRAAAAAPLGGGMLLLVAFGGREGKPWAIAGKAEEARRGGTLACGSTLAPRIGDATAASIRFFFFSFFF